MANLQGQPSSSAAGNPPAYLTYDPIPVSAATAKGEWDRQIELMGIKTPISWGTKKSKDKTACKTNKDRLVKRAQRCCYPDAIENEDPNHATLPPKERFMANYGHDYWGQGVDRQKSLFEPDPEKGFKYPRDYERPGSIFNRNLDNFFQYVQPKAAAASRQHDKSNSVPQPSAAKRSAEQAGLPDPHSGANTRSRTGRGAGGNGSSQPGSAGSPGNRSESTSVARGGPRRQGGASVAPSASANDAQILEEDPVSSEDAVEIGWEKTRIALRSTDRLDLPPVWIDLRHRKKVEDWFVTLPHVIKLVDNSKYIFPVEAIGVEYQGTNFRYVRNRPRGATDDLEWLLCQMYQRSARNRERGATVNVTLHMAFCSLRQRHWEYPTPRPYDFPLHWTREDVYRFDPASDMYPYERAESADRDPSPEAYNAGFGSPPAGAQGPSYESAGNPAAGNSGMGSQTTSYQAPAFSAPMSPQPASQGPSLQYQTPAPFHAADPGVGSQGPAAQTSAPGFFTPVNPASNTQLPSYPGSGLGHYHTGGHGYNGGSQQ